MRVGEEIDRECTDCRTLRGHVVAAIEDGRPAALVCKFCGKKTTPRRAAAPRQSRSPLPSRRPLVSAPRREPEAGAAKAYAPAGTFATGDTIRHPTLGLGVVEQVTLDRKIHVRFGVATKILIAGRT